MTTKFDIKRSLYAKSFQFKTQLSRFEIKSKNEINKLSSKFIIDTLKLGRLKVQSIYVY